MSVEKQVASQTPRRHWFAVALAALLVIGAVAALVGGFMLGTRPPAADAPEDALDGWWILLAAAIVAGMLLALAWGMWKMQNWARTGVMLLIGAGLLYYLVTVLFTVSAEIFGGGQVLALGEIVRILFGALLRGIVVGIIPGGILYGLIRFELHFAENPEQRKFVDRMVRYLLMGTALSAILIVFLIIVFTMTEAWESIEKVGVDTMLLGTIWRPGSIIGTEDAQLGLLPMIVGSILVTFGAVALGVPLSVFSAILLAEIAPPLVREVVRPAIELLAGIPSVIYGLFGMVVISNLLLKIKVPYNTGKGLLNASIVLAVMIIPTITNIAEDAIRAVPRRYKEGSLALGVTRWQTIYKVILPAARSGIIAAIILGIGRALGETMAVIMVIGNSIAMPEPLNENPLTLLLSMARTLTGNIAVEINYATGTHRSALFFTGVLLFLMILLVNSVARYLMRERLAS